MCKLCLFSQFSELLQQDPAQKFTSEEDALEFYKKNVQLVNKNLETVIPKELLSGEISQCYDTKDFEKIIPDAVYNLKVAPSPYAPGGPIAIYNVNGGQFFVRLKPLEALDRC